MIMFCHSHSVFGGPMTLCVMMAQWHLALWCALRFIFVVLTVRE